jgi:hypothetical protein
MRTIFETCEPRREVREGELKEEIFAARLKDVLDGTAEPVYQDPAIFFENTYPTAGLKSLLAEALGRLTGLQPTNNPIIRLETAFGGGKTHNLIALYHAARGAAVPPSLVDPRLVPPPESIVIAGIVGSDLDPSHGIRHADMTTYTLWGELAYQLGGSAGYALVAESDRQSKAAPGTGVWERIIGERPALIMLDEIARHLRTAKAIPTGTGRSDLAEQTVAFLMSLLEFAASRERVVVVLTLADTADAFGRETEELRQELAEARRITARQERVISSASEAEISAIVTHRLFRRIDRTAAREVADAYHAYFTRLLDQGADLPQRAGRAEYAAEIAADYPFHPELLTTLNRKTSTIPNFQRTRGALRLLALVVRRLWEQRPADCTLIHPHHLDLSVDQIAADLTSRLDRPAFKQVIEADIVSPRAGSTAHAQQIDAGWVDAGKPPYAQRAATTVFLHSLTQGVASGVDPADLLLAVLQPGDDPALVAKALDRLVDTCWFLDYDGHRYRFKTEPSLNKIVAEEVALVGKTRAKAELDQRIRQIWKKGIFQPVFFPGEASEVDDDAGLPKLVIAHYDAATATAADPSPPALLRRLFDHAGSAEGYRVYKNNLVFLVADQEQVGHMVEVAQKHLAIGRIVGDTARMAEFTEEQRKKLKQMLEASELEVRVAITKAYRYLYYPSSDAAPSYLARETLPAQEQGDVNADQSATVLRVLRQLEKVLTAEDAPLAAAYLKAKAWDAGQTQMSTEDLRRAFAKRLGLRILLDPNQLKRTIRDGVKQGVWIYYDPHEQAGYGPPSPAPLVQLSEDVLLYTPEEARRLGIPIKGEQPAPSSEQEPGPQTCPVCGNPVQACTCGGGPGGNGPEPRPPRIVLRAEGVPAQAFQALVDQCQDYRVTAITRLIIRTQGSGRAAATDARALGLAIPQLGKGLLRIEQTMDAEFGSDEQFSLHFAGSWERYKRVKTLTDAFGQEAAKVMVKTTVRLDFPDGLEVAGDQFQAMQEVLSALNLGRLMLEAEPASTAVSGRAGGPL